MNGWIEVKDKLPEKSGTYLVIGKSGTAFVTHFYAKSEHNEKPHFSNKYVSHWKKQPTIKEII